MVKIMADTCPYLHSFYHESEGYVPFCEGRTLGGGIVNAAGAKALY